MQDDNGLRNGGPRNGVPKTDGVKLTPLQAKRRRQRNLAIGLALFGFVVLFYLITLVKLGTGAHH